MPWTAVRHSDSCPVMRPHPPPTPTPPAPSHSADPPETDAWGGASTEGVWVGGAGKLTGRAAPPCAGRPAGRTCRERSSAVEGKADERSKRGQKMVEGGQKWLTNGARPPLKEQGGEGGNTPPRTIRAGGAAYAAPARAGSAWERGAGCHREFMTRWRRCCVSGS
jgi:hypothetical protein